MHAVGAVALEKLWERVKATVDSVIVPTKVSELENDAGYLTEIDKNEMVQEVLAALPAAEGVSY